MACADRLRHSALVVLIVSALHLLVSCGVERDVSAPSVDDSALAPVPALPPELVRRLAPDDVVVGEADAAGISSTEAIDIVEAMYGADAGGAEPTVYGAVVTSSSAPVLRPGLHVRVVYAPPVAVSVAPPVGPEGERSDSLEFEADTFTFLDAETGEFLLTTQIGVDPAP